MRLSALASFATRFGPEFTMRYNEYRSRADQSPAPLRLFYSANQATAALEDVFNQTMPRRNGLRATWVMSYQEQKGARGSAVVGRIFGFSLLFVFLILAALY